jgi:hypothetical protein
MLIKEYIKKIARTIITGIRRLCEITCNVSLKIPLLNSAAIESPFKNKNRKEF